MGAACVFGSRGCSREGRLVCARDVSLAYICMHVLAPVDWARACAAAGPCVACSALGRQRYRATGPHPSLPPVPAPPGLRPPPLQAALPSASAAAAAGQGGGGEGILRTRTYDLLITYDKYYQARCACCAGLLSLCGVRAAALLRRAACNAWLRAGWGTVRGPPPLWGKRARLACSGRVLMCAIMRLCAGAALLADWV